MPKKRRLDPFLVWIYLLSVGAVYGVDISLGGQQDGFFLRELYDKNAVPNPNTASRTFIVNQPSDLYKIKAEYGPYESQQTLSRDLLDYAFSRSQSNNSLVYRSVAFNLDVSAHIVSKDISPKIPKLQVLVHATPLGRSTDSSSQRWCAQIFASAKDVNLSSVCIINEKKNVCVASLDLHKEWWTENSTSVKVSYSFNRIEQSDQCARESNSLIPGRSLLNNSEDGIFHQEITTLHLTRNKESFEEWKDQDILIDVPKEMFHQSDTFEIPIRLEKNSDLRTFVMRARVRQGLRITGARMTDLSSQWSIQVDIKENQKIGTVTAFVRDDKLYKKSVNVQDVFRWQMEVTEDTYESRDLGRVNWGIEYQNELASERYTPEQSKIVSRISIHGKDQQRLVPVLKVTEIVNVAILTGWEQVYPLHIFAVDDEDTLTDVSHLTKCHSNEVDVLKVASDCTSVYVDGAESRGSHNVTIIAKYGQTTAFIDVTVWVPEERLDIELSDTKLSRVKNWRVPGGDQSRFKRASDPYSKTYFDKYGPSTKGRSCELLRQQAIVDLFARFYIQTPKGTNYFMGPVTYLKVTDLVKGRLRMSDTRIATLDDNIIKGKEEGRTEIQLLSPRNGHVVAAKEIQVSHDKVSIKQLKLKLVTGMTMYVEPSKTIHGALVATAVIDGQFLGKNHEGIIDVEVIYSDNTSLPLHYISSDDYFLDVSAVDPNIVGVTLSVAPAYQPHIVANGEGRGEFLTVSLKLGKLCERKKSRPLISTSMVIDVDFSMERQIYDESKAQMDQTVLDTNRASDRWEERLSAKNLYNLNLTPEEKETSKFVKSKMKNFDDDGMLVITIKDDLGELAEPDVEAKQEPLRTKTLHDGLSPLEIGMYVLLAVFCVAMTVFMVNCIVFFVRYKRKQKPMKPGGKDAIKEANDWVWIGRATLERNSVYTQSNRTLMPEEDFNGNVNSSRPLSVGSSSSGCSSQSSSSGSSSSNPSNSNRNSVVSTYKGSECSIRITANPLNEEGAMGGVPEETASQFTAPQWDYEAMGMNYDQLLQYFDNLKESNA
ncbi:hypothetical protein ACF0H5_017057 [Mactra antiquata]